MNTSTNANRPTGQPANRKTNIVYVIDDLGMGGAQRQLVELVKSLPRDRYALHVISLSTEKCAFEPVIRRLGVPLTVIAQSGVWSPRAFSALCRTLRAERPDVVHTWLFTADLYGRLAAWLCRVPVILSAVRSVEPDKPAHYVLADRLLRRITTAFTVNAKAIGAVLAARERVNPSRIQTVYNGVDLAVFDPAKRDGAIRSQIAVGRDAPLIGIIGRLVPVKDHATFLRAAALVAREIPAARFLIVGGGPLRDELGRAVTRLHLEERVRFLDSQPEAADVFAALDLVVVTSRYEGCCNVILEGMAMGKPVIATAVGGNPELVVPGETGLLVPTEDPQNLSEAICHLLQDPPRMRAMGQAARRRVETQFTLAQMAAQTDRFYQAILREQGR